MSHPPAAIARPIAQAHTVHGVIAASRALFDYPVGSPQRNALCHAMTQRIAALWGGPDGRKVMRKTRLSGDLVRRARRAA